MTPSIPTGAALDRACAEAMGWHDFSGEQPNDYPCNAQLFGVRPGHERTWEQKEYVLGRERVPLFSTDHATLPESFAWLEGLPAVDGISLSQSWHAEKSWPWKWSATAHYSKTGPLARELNVTGHGATLPEAVARLVVAVSLALAKEKER